MRIMLWTVLLSLAQTSWAVPMPIRQSLTEKKNRYLNDGVFIGGQSTAGTSLLGVRRIYSAKAHIERVILDIGDVEAKSPGREVGYFNASVDSKENRVILDLSRLKYSRLSEQQIRALFKQSAFVSAVDFTVDPEDKMGKLVLRLKRPVRMEVFELLDAKKPARLVMDLTPISSKPLKGKL